MDVELSNVHTYSLFSCLCDFLWLLAFVQLIASERRLVVFLSPTWSDALAIDLAKVFDPCLLRSPFAACRYGAPS